MRTVSYSAESVSELVDSINGVGLLQNLVVHVLLGGRRMAVLNMLAEHGIIPADWLVRVKVIPQELATAASMTGKQAPQGAGSRRPGMVHRTHGAVLL